MDENFQSYNNHWLQYNNFHQDPNINGLLEIPFPNNANPEGSSFNSDHFFMDHPTYADHVSRFPSDHGEIIPKEGSNNTEDSGGGGRKEGSGKAAGKRRSRASRRTPPTLLNASVKNFRDLVQQYTGCESSSSSGKNQKGPINLSFGSSNDHHNQHQINHFAAQIPGFDGRYDHQNYHHHGPQHSLQEYDHLKQGFM